MKLAAIDWLCLGPRSLRPYALRRSNRLAHQFIIEDKLGAARLLIRSDTESVVGSESHNASALVQIIITEEITEEKGIKSYLDAQRLFTSWKQLLETRPDQTFLISQRSKAAEDSIHQILTLKWLPSSFFENIDDLNINPADLKPSTQEDHQRRTSLRKICIRKLVHCLHNVLFLSRRFSDSIQLASLVAEPQYRIFECFEPSDMQIFLSLIRDSILEVFKYSHDPLKPNI